MAEDGKIQGDYVVVQDSGEPLPILVAMFRINEKLLDQAHRQNAALERIAAALEFGTKIP